MDIKKVMGSFLRGHILKYFKFSRSSAVTLFFFSNFVDCNLLSTKLLSLNFIGHKKYELWQQICLKEKKLYEWCDSDEWGMQSKARPLLIIDTLIIWLILHAWMTAEVTAVVVKLRLRCTTTAFLNRKKTPSSGFISKHRYFLLYVFMTMPRMITNIHEEILIVEPEISRI